MFGIFLNRQHDFPQKSRQWKILLSTSLGLCLCVWAGNAGDVEAANGSQSGRSVNRSYNARVRQQRYGNAVKPNDPTVTPDKPQSESPEEEAPKDDDNDPETNDGIRDNAEGENDGIDDFQDGENDGMGDHDDLDEKEKSLRPSVESRSKIQKREYIRRKQ